MQYFFILGKNPELSLAEIVSLGGDFKLLYSNQEVAIFDIDHKIKPQELMSHLGGTIKIGEVIKGGSLNNIQVEDLVKIIEGNSENNKKVYFGFSVYGHNNKLKDKLKRWPMEVKKLLKTKNLVCRWVISKEDNLSSVIVKKNHLLDQGAEIIFLISNNKIYLGQTQAVQEFEEFSERDFGRQCRDIKSGMMPPKLARMMINLAQVKKDQILLDPFCGSGTILQEALLLDFQKVIGSDVSTKAVEDSKKNLDWLSEVRPRVPEVGPRYKLHELDAKNLSSKFKANSIDAIVTEPYLGPALRGKPKAEEVKKTVEELTKLYLEAFREFKKILKPKGRVVIIVPAFKISSDNLVHLPIIKEIKKLGFSIKNPLPENLAKGQHSLLYFRPDQKVLREVFVWELE